MKSIVTPHTKTGVLAHDFTATVDGPSRAKEPLLVPRGTRLKYIGRWVVDDLDWLALMLGQRMVEQFNLVGETNIRRAGRNTLAYHDADHYGITISGAYVIDVKIV